MACYWVDVDIAFDDYSGETSWEILKLDTSGDIVVKTYEAGDGERSYTESLCLEVGQYMFTIYDEAGDGLCCGPGEDGYYNVTSYGRVFAQGGEFGSDESTLFSISDRNCHHVDVSIVFDDYSGEISWEILKVDSSGDISVKKYEAEDGERSYTESLCLEDGQYRFTIYDKAGDGLCCGPGEDGYYNVTLYSHVIAQGGEFGSNETRLFTIPLRTSFPSQSPSASTFPTASPTKSPTPSPSDVSHTVMMLCAKLLIYYMLTLLCTCTFRAPRTFLSLASKTGMTSKPQ